MLLFIGRGILTQICLPRKEINCVWRGMTHDKIIPRLGRAELPLCPKVLGGAAAPPYRRSEELFPAPARGLANGAAAGRGRLFLAPRISLHKLRAT
jgi:hypothetical protein